MLAVTIWGRLAKRGVEINIQAAPGIVVRNAVGERDEMGQQRGKGCGATKVHERKAYEPAVRRDHATTKKYKPAVLQTLT